MKIAFLSFYSGAIDRGVETAVTALAARLGKKHDVVVFQAGQRLGQNTQTIVILHKQWPSDSSGSWWRILYFDYYSIKILLFTLKWVVYMFKHQYDVVIPTNGGWQVVVCRLVSWLLGKKMVVQGNAGIGRDDFWQLLWWPNYYIAISPQGKKWAQKRAPWVTITYIPYGVDLELFEKTAPHPVNLVKPIVLCVAAFAPYKQIELLINAMQYVKNGSLLLIGQGVLEKNLRQMGESLLGKRFHMLTTITHEHLIGYYKSASVFSLPSASSEAFGIVYIEALAAGLTVVAPDDEHRRSILGDAALYCNVADPIAFGQTLTQALTHSRNKESLLQAQNYSWDTIIANYEVVLKNLVA